MSQAERVGTLQHPKQVKEIANQDLQICLLFNAMSKGFSRLVASHATIPPDIRTAATTLISRSTDMEKVVLKYAPKADVTVREQTMVDGATLLSMLAELGTNESDAEYAEMFNIITECLSSVLYAQKHHKKLHFPKYKALIRLIAAEIKRDTNHQPSQVLFRKTPQCPEGEFYIRAGGVEDNTQMSHE